MRMIRQAISLRLAMRRDLIMESIYVVFFRVGAIMTRSTNRYEFPQKFMSNVGISKVMRLFRLGVAATFADV